MAAAGKLPEEISPELEEIRIATLDETRTRALEERCAEIERKEEADNGKGPQEGDLVLLRRLELDNQKGRKLEPRWEGPYLLDKMNYHRRSGILKSLHGEREVGRYHVNDMKLFVGRKGASSGQWKTMAREAFEQKEKINEVIKVQADAEATREQQQQSEPPDPHWWAEFVMYPDNADNEQDPAYWVNKMIHLPNLDRHIIRT